jgi:hypothetical protein
MNALVVEVFVRLQSNLVIILDRVIKVGIYRLGLALLTDRTNADFVRYGILGCCFLGDLFGSRLIRSFNISG